MKNLVFAGIASVAVLVASPAMASDSFANATAEMQTELAPVANFGRKGGGVTPMPHVGGGHNFGNHRWGPRMNGRWWVGFYAPGGWGGYRPAYRGFVLPSYWTNASYAIGNYNAYGLYPPMTGYGWSRYYDDAVLRDQRGYVHDMRQGIDWSRYEGGYAPEGSYQQPQYGPSMRPDGSVYDMSGAYQPQPYVEPQVVYQSGTGAPYAAPPMPHSAPVAAPYPAQPPMQGYPQGYQQDYRTPYGYERYESCLRNRGVAGGVIGAVVGGVAGNRIAGRGDRLGGTLLGLGLGGLAGAAIEKATNKCRKYLPQQSYMPAPQPQYHPAPQPYPQQQPYPGGYYYYPQPAPMVTTITVSPAVVTTTTYVTEEVEYVSVPVKKRVVRKKAYRPKRKPRCVCR